MRTIANLLFALLIAVPLAAQTPEAAAPAAPTGAEPEGFAGVPWGATTETLKTTFPKVKCKKPRKNKDGTTSERCDLSRFKIADVETIPTLYFTDGRLDVVAVSFTSYAYDDMKKLLVEKYGPTPAVETSKEQQSAFAHALVNPDKPAEIYETTRTTWEWPDTKVVLTDNRLNGPYSDRSHFVLTRITAAERAKQKKALEAF